MAASIRETTIYLARIGACWGIPKAGGKYAIHPDASYPHEKQMMEFNSMREVTEYLSYYSRARRAEQEGNESEAQKIMADYDLRS